MQAEIESSIQGCKDDITMLNNEALNMSTMRECEHELRELQPAIESLLRENAQAYKKALKKFRDKFAAEDAERQALYQAWRKENPGKGTMTWGGPETQRLFEQIAKAPETHANVISNMTCSYCKKDHGKPIKQCSGCEMQYYCDKVCQRKAWKAHKKLCRRVDKKPHKKTKEERALATWGQFEAFVESQPDEEEPKFRSKTLRVRIMTLNGTNVVNQPVMKCIDAAGTVRDVFVHPECGAPFLSQLTQGVYLEWKNPRYRKYESQGRSGVRIVKTDVSRIKITPSR